MHAEAVRSGAVASKTGLMHDGNRVLTCYECGIQYHLHYDNEAEQLLTFYSVLACEVITARHPLHVNNIVLQLPNTRRPARSQVMWSIRMNLGNLLKDKPGIS